jgi:hypothetical protein
MSVASGSKVRASDGRGLVLGKLLKSGGAGSVYLLPESPRQVAKIYHDSANRAQYERKVAAMLELSPQLTDLVENGKRYVQIAWPQALLRDDRGHFLGFAMPAVDVQATSELECILQERQARAAGLPTGLGAKITLAANLAAVIAELHRQGHHVIDLKPVNLRFYPQSLYMAMLDCDGFSIQGKGERFIADQITPDYLAPEFQASSIALGSEEQQDRFALAVVIFQLLNFGIHPFTGRPANDRVPTDIPGRIARHCYAYGLRANPDLGPGPVSGHQAMPSDLRLLFDRAFEGAGSARPSAVEWAGVLKVYAQRSSHRLAICGRNGEHQHFAGMPCATCARAALIASTASNVSAAKAASLALQPRLSAAWNRVAGIRVPHLQYPPQAAAPMRWATPPPTNNYTSPAPVSNWQRKSVTSFQALLVIMFGMGLLTFLLQPRDAGQRAQSSPSEFAASRVPKTLGDWAIVPVPFGLGPVQGHVDTVARSMASGSVADVETAMSTVRFLSNVHPQSTTDAADREEFKWLLANLAQAQSGLIETMANRRVETMAYHPYDGEMAYELGWLCLVDRQGENAKGWFLRAIWSDPENPKGWYGYGVASTEDALVVGALAHAMNLGPANPERKPESEDFRPDVIELAGIDPSLFALHLARAKQIAEAAH